MTKFIFTKSRFSFALFILFAILAISNFAVSAAETDSPRERLLLDFGWKFHLGDNWGLGEHLEKAGQSYGPAKINFNDSSWRTLNLPHDWAVELPFDANANFDHGYKPLGPDFPQNSIGWYRRTFSLPEADRGKRLWIEFDGVYRDCRVFLNGFLLAHHENGYNSFRCDITDTANCGGKNVLAVRVDASQFEGWFYEGAGIYRHVWLEKTSPVAIAPDGIFVWSEFKSNTPASNWPVTVRVQTQLQNSEANSTKATLKCELINPNGEPADSTVQTVSLKSHSKEQANSTFYLFPSNSIIETITVAGETAGWNPIELWSPENPKLYKLVTTVESGGKIVDQKETEFGIRTIAFDPNKGFLLNGKHYAIKGTCNHQDMAGVGSALPDALQNFRIATLKEMGCNAIRTSHNEPTAELLDACDRLGMLVMDENRRLGSDPQNLAYLEEQVRRDRNHPSVFIWSLCNEEIFQHSGTGARIYETMQNLVHQLDPTRLCTAAMNSWSDGRPNGFSTVMDVQGFNYINNGDMDGFHRSNPTKPCLGTEEASAYYTRGIYENTRTFESAYDDNKPGYGATAEEWWKYYSARPWASGSFAWTGFDYRGEAHPFGWPNISSEYGIIDTCGFPKDVYYYYQSWWTDKPVLHLMPHWNWPDKIGQDIEVWCFSNCKEVELFLNGQSLGRKAMPKNSHLQWTVKYAPGTLSAKGYDADGKIIAETKVETTGAPAAVQLTPDRSTINADGEDCSVITVSVADASGRIVPVADKLVHFVVSGPGRIIGLGNGNPICHEPDVYIDKPSSRAISINNWRMEKVPDTKNRPEVAEDFLPDKWDRVDVNSETGPLKPGESAVFRARVSVTDEELAVTNAVLHFGMIDDEGWVYVNGQLAGESHDWSSSPSFNVLKFLYAGENTIAVAVKNNEGDGGVNKGVTLDLDEKPVPAGWQRSVFNGLAQVIVQSTKDAGEIKLTATAGSLSPASQTIQSTRGLFQSYMP